MKKVPVITALVIVLFAAVGFFVKTPSAPPEFTRIILDHTLKVYVTPPCFDEAELTNFLEETTLATAKKVEYEPEGPCTKSSLMPEETPIILQWLNLADTPWGKDGQW